MAAAPPLSRGTTDGVHVAVRKDTQPSMQPGNIHVLLVDDEKLSRVVVSNLLRKCNYRVTVAESGLQALDALRQNPPGTFQLVLTDVMMPDVDGIELLRQVRQDDSYTSMPVVMMSANEHTDTVFECIRGGAEDYLLKPITKKEVQYIWQHVWRRQQQLTVRVPHMGEEGEDELKPSGSLSSDVPRAPLDLVQSSAAALQPAPQAEQVGESPADAATGPSRQRDTGAQAAAVAGAGHDAGLVSPFQAASVSAWQEATSQLRGGGAGAATSQAGAGRIAVQPTLQQGPQQGQQHQQAQQSASVAAASARAFVEMQHMLRQRQMSGQLASASQPPGVAGMPGVPRQAAAAGAAGPHRPQQRSQQQQPLLQTPGPRSTVAHSVQGISLAAYFAQRKQVVNSEISFRLFCGVLAMLRTHHAQGQAVGKVRPSCLRLVGNGAIAVGPEASSAAEDALYGSPEELLNAPPSVKSDIYSLGVLFFELFHPILDEAERAFVLNDLRHRILPMAVLQGHPHEAGFVVSLLHPDPRARPSVAQILRSQTLVVLYRSICGPKDQAGAGGGPSSKRGQQRRTAQHTADAAVDQEVLLEFLLMMRRAKRAELQRMRQQLAALEQDIGTTEGRLDSVLSAEEPCKSSNNPVDAAMRASLGNGAAQTPRKRRRTMQGTEPAAQLLSARSQSAPIIARSELDAAAAVTAERLRQAGAAVDRTDDPAFAAGASGSQAGASGQERGQSGAAPQQPQMLTAADVSWKRVQRAFPQLDDTFFQRRDAARAGPGIVKDLGGPSAVHAAVGSKRPAGAVGTAGAAPSAASEASGNHLWSFSEDLSKFARLNSLQVRATLKYGDLLNAADMVCCTAFDRDDEFFATAGVSRRIKIFEFGEVLDRDADIHYPVLEIPARSKLSSVCWNSYVKSNLICADYEGMIQLWDVSANSENMRFEEHSKRVWSVDFSQTDPTRFLSGSDDGTVRLWSMADESAVACIDSKANVCSVQFSPTNSHLMAFGSANYRVYLYDLRQISVPLTVIEGHSRAVSYVRWMGGNHLVSASTDNHLKLWDVAATTAATANMDPVMSYTGHVNEKNFVGLSVTAEGYLACGSENNSVYAYYKALPLPLAQHTFSASDPALGQEMDSGDCHQFVSTVCWNRKGSHLLAANSLGSIQILELT